MPERNIVPVEGIDKHGIIRDTAAVNLPVGAWSDARNVRFDDGSIFKFRGEREIFDETITLMNGTAAQEAAIAAGTPFAFNNIRYITYWENPNERVYVVIDETGIGLGGEHRVYTVTVNLQGHSIIFNRTPRNPLVPTEDVPFSVPVIDTSSNANISNYWTSAQFNGGFSVIINNGIEAPHHITATQGVNLDDDVAFEPLPGWDSYTSGTVIAELLSVQAGIIIANGNVLVAGALTENTRRILPAFSIFNNRITFDEQVSLLDNTEIRGYFETQDIDTFASIRLFVTVGSVDAVTTYTFTQADAIERNGNVSNLTDAEARDIILSHVFENFGDSARTGVYDFNPNQTLVTLRSLNGVVRVSDVAGPGEIPQNWDPFAVGVGTADEAILADTGRITAMHNLKGNVYVYTAQSIIQLRITAQGLLSSLVTDQYGAVSQNAVFDYRGSHFVVGSDDIYLFGGNPGDIKSVADTRVRRYFYDNVSAAFYGRLWIERNQTYDELWLAYPTLNSDVGAYDEALIWNYVNNTWTIRDLPNVNGMTTGPIPGGGNFETLVDFGGDDVTGVSTPGTFAVQDIVPTGSPDLRIEGTVELQNLTWTGTHSSTNTNQIDTFSVSVPGNFAPATDSTYDWDRDTTDGVIDIDDATFSGTTTGQAALEELLNAIAASDDAITASPVIGSGTTPGDFTVVIQQPVDATGSDFQLYSGLGNNAQVTTNLDLSGDNRGFTWIKSTNDLGPDEDNVFFSSNSPTISLDTNLQGILTVEDGQDTGANALITYNATGFLTGPNADDRVSRTDAQQYFAWTMKDTPGLLSSQRYQGGSINRLTGIDIIDDNSSFTATADDTVVAVVLIAGGGGTTTVANGVAPSGGQGGGLLWYNFTINNGDVIRLNQGIGGVGAVSAGNPGARGGNGGPASLFLTPSGGVSQLLASAPGGTGGGVGVAPAPHTAADFTIDTTYSGYISHGMGVGGLAGFGSLTNQNLAGGGGGAGGYNGDGGKGGDGVDSNDPRSQGGAATPNSGGAGGGGTGQSGGAVSWFGIRETGGNSGAQPGNNGSRGGTRSGEFRFGAGARGDQNAQQSGTVGGNRAIIGQDAQEAITLTGGMRPRSPTFGQTPNFGPTALTTSPLVRQLNANFLTHTLGTAPGVMLIKNVTVPNAQPWIFWHRDLDHTVGAHLELQSSTPQNRVGATDDTFFSGVVPNEADFLVGSLSGGGATSVNDGSGPTGEASEYSAHLFGHDELPTRTPGSRFLGNDPDPSGNIYCGSYVGSPAAFDLDFGWTPTIFLVKINVSTSWALVYPDGNGSAEVQTPDGSVRSATFVGADDFFTPTGVRIPAAANSNPNERINSSGVNDSAATYYFMAVRTPVGPGLLEDVATYTGSADDQIVDTQVNLSDNALGFTWSKDYGRNTGQHFLAISAPQPDGVLTDTRLNMYRTTGANQAGIVADRGPNSALPFYTYNETGMNIPGGQSDIGVLNESYLAWNMRAQPGLLDVVSWRGGATAAAGTPNIIPHNIGKIPGFMMIRQSDGQGAWTLWHKDLIDLSASRDSYFDTWGDDRAIREDSTQSVFANNSINANNFTAGSATGGYRLMSEEASQTHHGVINEPGVDYVGLIFGDDGGHGGDANTDGNIAVGTYNGSPSSIPLIFGWEAELILVKARLNSFGWVMVFNDNGVARAVQPGNVNGDAVFTGFDNTERNNFFGSDRVVIPSPFTNPPDQYLNRGETSDNFHYIAFRKGVAGARVPNTVDFSAGGSTLIPNADIPHNFNESVIFPSLSNRKIVETGQDLTVGNSMSINFRPDESLDTDISSGQRTTISNSVVRSSTSAETSVNNDLFYHDITGFNTLVQNTQNAWVPQANQFNNVRGTNGFTVNAVSSTGVFGDTNNANNTLTFAGREGFFDVVEWEGNGGTGSIDNRFIPHNLNAEIGMMWISQYDTSGSSGILNGIDSQMFVYHRGMGDADVDGGAPNDAHLFFNTTLNAARGTEFNSAGSGSPFGPRTSSTLPADIGGFEVRGNLNYQSNKFVAYIWAHNPAAGIECGYVDQAGTAGWSFTTQGRAKTIFATGTRAGVGDNDTTWRADTQFTGFGGNFSTADDQNRHYQLGSTTGEVISRPYALVQSDTRVDVRSALAAPTDNGGTQRYIYMTTTEPVPQRLLAAPRFVGRGDRSDTPDNILVNTDIRLGTGSNGIAIISPGTTGTAKSSELYSTRFETSQSFGLANADSLGVTPLVERVAFNDGNIFLNSGGWNFSTVFEALTIRESPGFFEHVRFETNGPSPQTVPHTLGTAPAMVWLKDEQSSSATWRTFHRDSEISERSTGNPIVVSPENRTGDISEETSWSNNTNTWDNQLPDSDNVYLGTDATGQGTNDHSMFLFGSDGVSCQAGAINVLATSVGNNSVSVTLPFRPAFIMMKRTNGATGGTETSSNPGIGPGWNYWTADRANFGAVGALTSQVINFSNTQGQTTGFGPVFGNAGFSVRINVAGDEDSNFVYWAVAEEAIGSSLIETIPDFELVNDQGVLTNIPEVNRVAWAAATSSEEARDALLAGVNAFDAGTGLDWTAVLDGDNVRISQNAYTTVGITDQVASSGLTGTVRAVDNTGNFPDITDLTVIESGDTGGFTGSLSITTSTDLTSAITFNQGSGMNVMFDATPVQGILASTASTYVITPTMDTSNPPTSREVMSFVADATETDIDAIIVEFIDFINTNTEAPTNFTTPAFAAGTYGDGATGIVLTADHRGNAVNSFNIVSTHTGTDEGLFEFFVDQVAGTGIDDTFLELVTTVVIDGDQNDAPSFVPSAQDVDESLTIRETTKVIPRNIPTETQVVTIGLSDAEKAERQDDNAKSNLTPAEIVTRTVAGWGVSQFTPTATATAVRLTANNARPFPGDIAATTNMPIVLWTHTPIVRGVDPTVIGTMDVSINNPRFRTTTNFLTDQPLSGETAAELNDRFFAEFNNTQTPTFISEQINPTDTTLTSLQFGNQAISFDYEVFPGTKTDGVDDLLGYAIYTDVNAPRSISGEIDIERPWSEGVLNESRNFIVAAGADGQNEGATSTIGRIYAMDLGYSFDFRKDINGNFVDAEGVIIADQSNKRVRVPQPIPAYVERRNLELAPLRDTEQMSGLFMNTTGDIGDFNNFTVNVQPVDNSSSPVDFSSLENGPYNFIFSGDGADYKIDTRVTGRLLNVRIENESDLEFEIQGMMFEVSKGGTR